MFEFCSQSLTEGNHECTFVRVSRQLGRTHTRSVSVSGGGVQLLPTSISTRPTAVRVQQRWTTANGEKQEVVGAAAAAAAQTNIVNLAPCGSLVVFGITSGVHGSIVY